MHGDGRLGRNRGNTGADPTPVAQFDFASVTTTHQTTGWDKNTRSRGNVIKIITWFTANRNVSGQKNDLNHVWFDLNNWSVISVYYRFILIKRQDIIKLSIEDVSP